MSRFSAAALASQASPAVQVMWPALRNIVPAARAREDFGLPRGAFVVLSMFDLLSEVDRKNPFALVRAFRQAFAATEDVRLVLKVSGGETRPDERRRLFQALAGTGVIVVEDSLPGPDLAALMAHADVYASLHRAEGFGLTLAEAMRLGKPVVATYYSGNVDFMTPWNSCPVPYALIELDRDHGPYRRGSVWADPDADAAAAILRELYGDRDRGRRLGQRAREDVAAQLSPHACGGRMVERLRVLAAVKAATGRQRP